MPNWRNWARTVTHRNLVEEYKPASLDELQAAVKDARNRGLKLRAVGSGHSWSNLGLPESNAAVVLTEKLDKILEVDREAKTVRVECGIKLDDFNRKLDDLGLALPNLGDIDRQAIVGAISTDTHGSGAAMVTFPELVEAITLVKADGSVYEVPEPQLPAARVSLGALGVIYAVKLNVRDRLFLRHESRVVETRNERDDLPTLLANNRNLEYWYYPYTARAERVVRNEIQPVKGRRYVLQRISLAIGALWADFNGRVWPSRLPRLFNRAMDIRRPQVREGPSYEILPSVAQSTVDLLRTYTMEYQFDHTRLWDALDELDQSIEEAKGKGVYLSVPIHIRFSKKSERSLLSPAVHPITASFSLNFSRNYDGVHKWFPDIEKRLLNLGAKPHLGKMYYIEPELPEEFHRIRRELDPTEMFWNPQKPYVADEE